MHARVLRLKGTADKVDAGIENYRSQVVPSLREQDGYSGARLLVDRESGTALSITFWRDEEAARASFEAMANLRTEAASRFGAEQPETKVYEAAVQQRPQPTEEGNWVRLTTLQGDPAKTDDGIAHFESQVVPGMAELAGFRGAVLFVDRASGDALGATVWNSKGDLEGGAEKAGSIRSAASQVMGAASPQVETFEVAFAELPAAVGS